MSAIKLGDLSLELKVGDKVFVGDKAATIQGFGILAVSSSEVKLGAVCNGQLVDPLSLTLAPVVQAASAELPIEEEDEDEPKKKARKDHPPAMKG